MLGSRLNIPRYKLIQLLGQGSSALVYKAIRQDRETNLNQTVALKILKSKKWVQAWKHEFEKLSQLRSSYCVGVFGWEWVRGKPALVMEWVEGVSLRELIVHSELTSQEITYICHHIQEALLYLSSNNVAHGDLSPGNILIDNRGRIKLVDFGLQSSVGKVRATPGFVAPEILKGQPPDFKSDLYSLGCIWVQMDPMAAFDSQISQLIAADPFARRELKLKSSPSQQQAVARKVSEVLAERVESQTMEMDEPSRQRAGNRAFMTLCAVIVLFSVLGGSWPHAKAISSPQSAYISVRSNKWAKVWIQDREIGFSPFGPVEVAAEKVTIRWTHATGQGQQTLTLQKGQHIVLDDHFFTRHQ